MCWRASNRRHVRAALLLDSLPFSICLPLPTYTCGDFPSVILRALALKLRIIIKWRIMFQSESAWMPMLIKNATFCRSDVWSCLPKGYTVQFCYNDLFQAVTKIKKSKNTKSSPCYPSKVAISHQTSYSLYSADIHFFFFFRNAMQAGSVHTNCKICELDDRGGHFGSW